MPSRSRPKPVPPRPASPAPPQPVSSAPARPVSPAPARSARLRPIGGLEALATVKAALLREAEDRRERAIRERREREAREREARVFQDALAGVRPLEPTGRVRLVAPRTPPVPAQTRRDESAALAQSLSDEIDVERLLDVDEQLSFRRAGVGGDTLRKLRRGEWSVQARLDLHGLRTDQAREAIAAFLPGCVRDGLRCVRIIHGKGLGSVDRQPVLKDKVLRWLSQRQEVLAFCQAPPFAGGSGALLVLLRAPA